MDQYKAELKNVCQSAAQGISVILGRQREIEEKKYKLAKELAQLIKLFNEKKDEVNTVERELEEIRKSVRSFAVANYRLHCHSHPVPAPSCDQIKKNLKDDNRYDDYLGDFLERLQQYPVEHDHLIQRGFLRGAAGIPRICTICGHDREWRNASELPCFFCGRWDCPRKGHGDYMCQCVDKHEASTFDTSHLSPSVVYKPPSQGSS
ncbi:hypothetical protein [Sicyoidochytrium minutum DNA virus]|nr:hypothetical protein [Sicyoidochytrium minutum DNA virus]